MVKKTENTVLRSAAAPAPLAEAEMCTVTVTAGTNAEGGTLTLNDEPAEFGVGKEFSVGTQVTVKVVKTGFNTFTEQVSCDSTEPKSVTANLTKQQFLVTVNEGTDASGATIQINGEAYSEPKNFDYGTRIEVTATKEGFNDFSQVIESLTKPETITVNLTKKQFLVTVNTGENAEGATIQINGESYTAPKNFDYGTKIDVTATKTGYKNFSQSIPSLTKAETITVNMVALVKPTITTTLQDTINAEEETAFNVVINGKDYSGTNAKIKGTVNQKDLVTLKYNDSPVSIGGDGTFEIDSEGFNLTGEDITKAFKITIADGTSLNLKLELLKQDDGTSLCDTLEKTITVTDKNCNLKVVKGSNADDASVTISYGETNDEPLEFDTNKRLPIGTEVTIKATKTGFVNFVQKVTLVANEDKSVTIDLTKQQFTVTINNQNESTITVNEAPYTEPLTLDYGTQVVIVIKANKTGFAEYTKTIESLTQNETIDITDSVMSKAQFKLTVVPTPSDAIVKLNGTELKEITVDYGTEVTIEVSKEGYLTKTEKVIVTEETSKEITLEKKKVTLTITTQPSDATVKLNSEEKRTIEVDYGTEVTIEVSKQYYETYSDTITLTQSESKNIQLKREMCDVKVTANELDALKNALIKINDTVTQQDVPVKVAKNTNAKISVTQNGYKPFNVNVWIMDDSDVKVNLDGEWKKPQLSVTVQNKEGEQIENAVITVNNEILESGVSKDIDYNTSVNINVKADGYKEFNETKVITEDYACVDKLLTNETETVSITVNVEPEDAEVTINDITGKILEVEKGSEVTIKATKEGYKDYSTQITADETKTVEVVLEKKEYTLTVKTTPEDAKTLINGVETKTHKGYFNDTVIVETSKEGYQTDRKTVKLTYENQTLTVVLLGEDEKPDLDTFLKNANTILKMNNNYSYLNCSRHIIQNGVTEESLFEFYKEFGYYVMSKTDFDLWRMMHNYYGHIDGIPEAENDKFIK